MSTRIERELEEMEHYLLAIYYGKRPEIPSPQENLDTIKSVRKNWEVLDIRPDGIIIQTPSGKFRLQERVDGSLERLERIE